ncbi:unnamed protein product (macronuclear) [Paramecium tetraurelia]|uniref:DNA sliding clamp PCNA n=1 Tax=Paramecium tetraurelia TaxID=5888 RepID=A0CSY4_PARTE|nr:uncharacterized protein GSPATT00010174001 [Paramecium tetraurelia]CAK73901.1 unnamed protein product [Paramecium tetraurelia]|eukprot:XP_001441298.1 hypothetical protein (macronuclear) [Paramecium tetraurelia strain d4-2]
MFEAKFQVGALFKKIVEAIKELVKNVNLETNGIGISQWIDNDQITQIMDAMHVALAAFKLNGKSLTLGFGFENLQQILRTKIKQLWELKMKNQQHHPLHLNRLDRIGEFQLNLMSLDQEWLRVHETDYSSIIRMSSNLFTKIHRELGNINQAVGIETSKGFMSGFCQTYNSDKLEEYEVFEQRGKIIMIMMDNSNLFNKAPTLSNQLILLMSQDQQLIIEYTIGVMGSLKLYLAPKINDEESQ